MKAELETGPLSLERGSRPIGPISRSKTRRPARQSKQLVEIRTEAQALVSALGIQAYAEARSRERASQSESDEAYWRAVAVNIAQQYRKRLGPEAASLAIAETELSALVAAITSSSVQACRRVGS